MLEDSVEAFAGQWEVLRECIEVYFVEELYNIRRMNMSVTVAKNKNIMQALTTNLDWQCFQSFHGETHGCREKWRRRKDKGKREKQFWSSWMKTREIGSNSFVGVISPIKEASEPVLRRSLFNLVPCFDLLRDFSDYGASSLSWKHYLDRNNLS